MERTYGQYCPVAAGLDVIGDRWTLLICRELVLGDRRFTDLRNALPGIAPNLLSERLRALQAADMVITAELPPPAARTVYRLTDQGRDVVPVLRAVARLGARYLDGEPSPTFTAVRGAFSMLMPWARPADPGFTLRLEFGPTDHADVRVTPTSVEAVSASTDAVTDVVPDVVLHTTADALAETRRSGSALVGQWTGPTHLQHAAQRAFQLAHH